MTAAERMRRWRRAHKRCGLIHLSPSIFSARWDFCFSSSPPRSCGGADMSTLANIMWAVCVVGFGAWTLLCVAMAL